MSVAGVVPPVYESASEDAGNGSLMRCVYFVGLS